MLDVTCGIESSSFEKLFKNSKQRLGFGAPEIEGLVAVEFGEDTSPTPLGP